MLRVILTIGSIQVVAIAIQFVRTKVVAVMLGPEGVGVVSTIDQIVQFAAFATALSIPMASVKFLSKAHSEGHDGFKRTYTGFLNLLLLLSVAGTILAVGLVFLRPQTLGAEVQKYQLYVLIALFSLPTLVLAGFFSNVFAAARNYRASAALAVISNAAATIAIIIGIGAAGLVGLFFGGSLANILLTIGILIYFSRKMDLPFFTGDLRVLTELRRTPNIASFTALLYIGSVSYSLSLLVARYAILSNFGEAAAGLLQGALVLSVAIGMVLNPANGLYLTPIMNRSIEKLEKISHAIEFQRKMIFILSLVSLPVVMFPQLMLTVLFSTKFASVGHLVYAFIIGQFVVQLAGVHQALLIGTEDFKAQTLIVTTGQIGFALLAWFLAPVYGIYGVAIGSVISSLVIFSATFFRLKLKHGYSVPKNLAGLFAYTLTILILTGWVCSQINEWDISIAAAKIIFFALFVLSLLFFLNSDEWGAIYRIRNRISFGR
ncbi:MAG: oligosaccharide flippase family protein [Pyrinomonadaceae bacterium]